MKPKPNPELVDEENPEWTDADFRRAVPFSRLPLAMQQKLGGDERQRVAPTGAVVEVSLSAEVVAGFRASGAGWEARMNAVLAEWLATHSQEGMGRD